MAMKGFDPEFRDLVDYILVITDRIWEKRNVGLIRRHYAPDVVMHTPMGPSGGAAGVVSGTLATLHSFPDRRLLGEDVIWSGDEDAGFLSSHRIVSTMTHRGSGMFGEPTARPIVARTIADCFCIDNVIKEEWLVRDQAAIALQIGHDPSELGKRLAEADAVAGKTPWHIEEWEAVQSGKTAPKLLQDDPAAALIRQHLEDIVNGTNLGVIEQNCDEAYGALLPGRREAYGKAALDAFWIGYLASFPDAQLVVDHSIALRETHRAVRVATRWRMAGTHSGVGAFGAPTQARVLILGITHSEIVDNRISREWHLIDELALWKMIALQSG
jgi:predicted ester cyclase